MQPSQVGSEVSGALPGHILQESFCDTDTTKTKRPAMEAPVATPERRRWRQEEENSRPSAATEQDLASLGYLKPFSKKPN